jgi:hypothetical protein
VKIGELKKLLEDADPEGNVLFHLGDHCTPLTPNEYYTTATKDAAYIEFLVPDGWSRT